MPIINSAIASVTRAITGVSTGSGTQRYGQGAGLNINAVADSGVLDATNNSRFRSSLFGRITSGGINVGLAAAAAFQNGLYESQSLPPAGVNGSGETAQSSGNPNAQRTSSINPNNNGLSPSQVSALNQANKLDPLTLSKLLAERTNETNSRRNPDLRGKEATEDPILNNTLKELGLTMNDNLKKLDQAVKKAFEDLEDNHIKEVFRGTKFENQFNTKNDLEHYWNQLKKNLKEDQSTGSYKESNLERLKEFIGAVPKSYTDIHEEGEKYLNSYQKGLDQKNNDRVSGNFLTSLNNLESDNGLLNDFRTNNTSPEAQEFAQKAEAAIREARENLSNSTSREESQAYLEGRFNDTITELKESSFGKTPKGKAIIEEMEFMQFSSPHAEHATSLESVLDDLSANANGQPITVDSIRNNTNAMGFLREYYSNEDISDKEIERTLGVSASETSTSPSSGHEVSFRPLSMASNSSLENINFSGLDDNDLDEMIDAEDFSLDAEDFSLDAEDFSLDA